MLTITNNALTVLADPTRQALLQMLRRKPMSVGELAARLPVSRPAVSQHLKVLSSANMVNEERTGTRHYFSLNPKGFAEIHSYITSMWQDALNSFATYVREQESSKTRKTKRRKK
jgi:DNA-binding transcriptional ArsR family regulator